jgi:RNA polymerase sigma-32 factor
VRGSARASRAYSLAVATTSRLSDAEQQALAERYARTRSPEDRRRLVLANLRLVLAIAKSLGAGRPDFMDLVQEGNAGLLVALERFDPSRRLSLAGYASIWIRAFMLKHLMEASSAVRATTTREGRRRFFERTLPIDVSFDGPARRGDDERPRVVDVFPGDDALRPDRAAEARDELRRLRDALLRLEETMTERDRAILTGRLLCEEPLPLRRLGPTVGLSGERVRQLERDLLTRLRTYIGATGGGEVRQAA